MALNTAFDLIVYGVTLPDGRRADVGVQSSVIASIEEVLSVTALQEIKAEGRYNPLGLLNLGKISAQNILKWQGQTL